MTNLSGQYLGRYYLKEQLGEGGMAVVYKAYDTRLERDVAVKIIRSGAFPADALDEVLKRFEREAKSLAKLSHPNIVKVHDYGEHEGSPYLVMEYLPGGTLKQTLGKSVPWQDAVRLILPVARGVAYAHHRGVLHRDIKPANILITESGEPMLSDFGIAKLFEADQTTALTESGMAIGTPEYMAPEQWTGITSPQSDLYSLGVVLYEMVAGRKPYVADTPAAILIKQATEPLPSPRKFANDLPEALELVLIKALAKEPRDRYKDLNGFIDVLENLLADVVSPPVFKQKHVVTLPVPKSPHTDGEKVHTADMAESKKVGESFHPRLSSSIKLTRKSLGFLIGGVVIVLAAWFSLPLIGKWFVPAPVSTEPTTATLTLTELPIESMPANKTEIPTVAFTSTDSIVETPLSITPTLASRTTQISPMDGMALLYVPAGEFYMGSDCHEPGCIFKHGGQIDFTEAYWIDKTEIANVMYRKCVTANICEPPSKVSLGSIKNYYANTDYDNYPVVNITFQQAKSYCEWSGRRLPTDKEWEKAARGIDGRGFPWGNDHQGYEANFCDVNCTDPNNRDKNANDRFIYTAPVDAFSSFSSPYGALNMAGNVSELIETQDYRGGAWNTPERMLWTFSTVMLGYTPPNDAIGFRCALSEDSTIPQPEITQTSTPVLETNVLPTEVTDSKNVQMVLVPAGEFTMGGENGNPNEKPVHKVYLDSFYMDIYEVTNALYKSCVDAGGCTPPKQTGSYSRSAYYGVVEFNDYPVINVDWSQANNYCKWRGGSLPTEAQWEKAARGTDGRTYPWGEESECLRANSFGCGSFETRVGSFAEGKSPYGIYDMAGNVQEWVADWYGADYYANSPTSNPLGPDAGQYRVVRGGFYFGDVRSMYRTFFAPSFARADIGFRCAKDATP